MPVLSFPRVSVRSAVVIAAPPPTKPGRNRLEIVAVAAYLVLLAVAMARTARVRLFWFDELFTLHLARHPGTLFANLAAGVDLNPPLSYLLTAACVAVFGETPVAARLPAVAGAVLAAWAVYRFVRRGHSSGAAAVGMAAVSATPAVWVYFTEARPYGLMIGLAGLVLLAWQRAGDGRAWRITFILSALAGVSTHYFFAVPLVAVGAAELFRAWATRRTVRAVWVGLVAAALLEAAYAAAWGGAGRAYAPGFWAKAPFTLAAVLDTYHKLLPADLGPPVLVALMIAAVGGKLAKTPPDVSRPDVFAAAAVVLGPVFALALAAAAGGFYHRYALPTAVGAAILLGVAVGRVTGGATWAGWLAAAVLGYCGAAGTWFAGPGYFRAEARDTRDAADWLDAHAAGGTVVFDSAFDFARTTHHHPGRTFRPAFATDPEMARVKMASDTIDRGLIALAPVAGLPVTDADAVAAKVAAGEAVYFLGPVGSWRAAELIARGAAFAPVAARNGVTLYRLRKD